MKFGVRTGPKVQGNVKGKREEFSSQFSITRQAQLSLNLPKTVVLEDFEGFSKDFDTIRCTTT